MCLSIDNLISNFINSINSVEYQYKYSCSEISLKLAALNLCQEKKFLELEKLNRAMFELDNLPGIENKLIVSSLLISKFDNINEVIDSFKFIHLHLSKVLHRGLYSLLCSFILLLSTEDYRGYLDKFLRFYDSIQSYHPILNFFEYSPMILLTSLNTAEIEKKVMNIEALYNTLHEAGFAGGTNLFISSLYLSSLEEEIDAKRARNIYLNLKSQIPVNPFNYLNTSLLYGYNDPANLAEIKIIYDKIANENSSKWYSEQLDSAIAISLYLNYKNYSPFNHDKFNFDNVSLSNLLTTLVISTLLLNKEDTTVAAL